MASFYLYEFVLWYSTHFSSACMQVYFLGMSGRSGAWSDRQQQKNKKQNKQKCTQIWISHSDCMKDELQTRITPKKGENRQESHLSLGPVFDDLGHDCPRQGSEQLIHLWLHSLTGGRSMKLACISSNYLCMSAFVLLQILRVALGCVFFFNSCQPVMDFSSVTVASFYLDVLI